MIIAIVVVAAIIGIVAVMIRRRKAAAKENVGRMNHSVNLDIGGNFSGKQIEPKGKKISGPC